MSAATHSQARYALPATVRDVRASQPKLQQHLHQGTTQQVAGMLHAGQPAPAGTPARIALAGSSALLTLAPATKRVMLRGRSPAPAARRQVQGVAQLLPARA